MDREMRAKQFAPFEALSGLREALRKKEIEHESQQKKELSEDRMIEISETLSMLEKGNFVEVKFFDSGYYITIVGEIIKIDFIRKHLTIGEGKILFEDIYDIKRTNEGNG